MIGLRVFSELNFFTFFEFFLNFLNLNFKLSKNGKKKSDVNICKDSATKIKK